MYDALTIKFSILFSAFTSDKLFHGLLGTLVFLIVILILYQVPAPLRKLRRIWVLETVAAAVLIIILTAIAEFILISLNFYKIQNRE